MIKTPRGKGIYCLPGWRPIETWIIGLLSIFVLVYPVSVSISQGVIFAHDNLYWFLPFFFLIHDSLEAGVLPLWNEYSHGGEPTLIPFVQQMLFSPLTVLVAFLGSKTGIDVPTLAVIERTVKILFTGFGYFFFLRHWCLSPGSRLTLFSLIFFSPFLTNSFHQNGILDHFFLSGWILYFGWRVFALRDFRWRNFVGLSIFYGQTFLSYFFYGPTLLILALTAYCIGVAKFRDKRPIIYRELVPKAIVSSLILAPALILNVAAYLTFDNYTPAVRNVSIEDAAAVTPIAVNHQTRESNLQPNALDRYSETTEAIGFNGSPSFLNDFAYIFFPATHSSLEQLGKVSEAAIFLPLTSLALFLTGLFCSRASDKIFAGSICLFFGLISLGPSGGIFPLLQNIPGLVFFRHTEQMFSYFLVGILVFILIGYQHLARICGGLIASKRLTDDRPPLYSVKAILPLFATTALAFSSFFLLERSSLFPHAPIEFLIFTTLGGLGFFFLRKLNSFDRHLCTYLLTICGFAFYFLSAYRDEGLGLLEEVEFLLLVLATMLIFARSVLVVRISRVDLSAVRTHLIDPAGKVTCSLISVAVFLMFINTWMFENSVIFNQIWAVVHDGSYPALKRLSIFIMVIPSLIFGYILFVESSSADLWRSFLLGAVASFGGVVAASYLFNVVSATSILVIHIIFVITLIFIRQLQPKLNALGMVAGYATVLTFSLASSSVDSSLAQSVRHLHYPFMALKPLAMIGLVLAIVVFVLTAMAKSGLIMGRLATGFKQLLSTLNPRSVFTAVVPIVILLSSGSGYFEIIKKEFSTQIMAEIYSPKTHVPQISVTGQIPFSIEYERIQPQIIRYPELMLQQHVLLDTYAEHGYMRPADYNVGLYTSLPFIWSTRYGKFLELGLTDDQASEVFGVGEPLVTLRDSAVFSDDSLNSLKSLALGGNLGRLRSMVILEENIDIDPDHREGCDKTQLRGQDSGLSVLSADPNTFSVRKPGGRGGYLLLKQQYDHDWRATINGFPVPIKLANGLFMAVPVSCEESLVVFQYRPSLVLAGIAGYWIPPLIGVFLLLSILVSSLLRKP